MSIRVTTRSGAVYIISAAPHEHTRTVTCVRGTFEGQFASDLLVDTVVVGKPLHATTLTGQFFLRTTPVVSIEPVMMPVPAQPNAHERAYAEVLVSLHRIAG